MGRPADGGKLADEDAGVVLQLKCPDGGELLVEPCLVERAAVRERAGVRLACGIAIESLVRVSPRLVHVDLVDDIVRR